MDTSLNAFLPTRRTTYCENECLGLPIRTMTDSFRKEAGQGIEGKSCYIILQMLLQIPFSFM